MISVITPCLEKHFDFLAAAYESLCLQKVDWEWLIQIDGKKIPQLPVDSRISLVCNKRSLGVSVSRNRALARSQG